jgi:hypothetical protein
VHRLDFLVGGHARLDDPGRVDQAQPAQQRNGDLEPARVQRVVIIEAVRRERIAPDECGGGRQEGSSQCGFRAEATIPPESS